MFVKIDKKTRKEVILSSTEMTNILERDISANRVNATLTDMAMGEYEHQDRESIYKYKA